MGEDTIKWFVDDIEMFRVTPSSFNTIPSLNSWHLTMEAGIL